jgi:hypothetical protein
MFSLAVPKQESGNTFKVLRVFKKIFAEVEERDSMKMFL